MSSASPVFITHRAAELAAEYLRALPAFADTPVHTDMEPAVKRLPVVLVDCREARAEVEGADIYRMPLRVAAVCSADDTSRVAAVEFASQVQDAMHPTAGILAALADGGLLVTAYWLAGCRTEIGERVWECELEAVLVASPAPEPDPEPDPGP
jgi:hypothetical protein